MKKDNNYFHFVSICISDEFDQRCLPVEGFRSDQSNDIRDREAARLLKTSEVPTKNP